MQKAQEMADELGLDLVEVSPSAKPPVVKLIDYGKFKYQQQKKAAEERAERRKQAQMEKEKKAAEAEAAKRKDGVDPTRPPTTDDQPESDKPEKSKGRVILCKQASAQSGLSGSRRSPWPRRARRKARASLRRGAPASSSGRDKRSPPSGS